MAESDRSNSDAAGRDPSVRSMADPDVVEEMSRMGWTYVGSTSSGTEDSSGLVMFVKTSPKEEDASWAGNRRRLREGKR